jgi:hypothetical protein
MGLNKSIEPTGDKLAVFSHLSYFPCGSLWSLAQIAFENPR